MAEPVRLDPFQTIVEVGWGARFRQELECRFHNAPGQGGGFMDFVEFDAGKGIIGTRWRGFTQDDEGHPNAATATGTCKSFNKKDDPATATPVQTMSFGLAFPVSDHPVYPVIATTYFNPKTGELS